jgi:hypothetical protein
MDCVAHQSCMCHVVLMPIICMDTQSLCLICILAQALSMQMAALGVSVTCGQLQLRKHSHPHHLLHMCSQKAEPNHSAQLTVHNSISQSQLFTFSPA